MDPGDDLDDFLDRIQPLRPAEQREMLLGYFAAYLPSFGRDALLLMRERLAGRGGIEGETLAEVIDGHLALRDIAQD